MTFFWNKPRYKYTLFCLWTDDTPMSENRKARLYELLQAAKPCEVKLLTKETILKYVVPYAPLHPAYPYLSAVHKSDYFRSYLMNFHGGGYTDIKTPYGWPWVDAFRDFELNPNAMINIRQPGTAMICRPQTDLTKRWYAEVCRLLDIHLESLKKHPGPSPYTCFENDPTYPIGWTEIMLDVLLPLCEEFAKKGHVMTTVPMVFVHNHR